MGAFLLTIEMCRLCEMKDSRQYRIDVRYYIDKESKAEQKEGT
nr:MAG TPA: hypothetical protein [Caudoviricetes sp.]